MFIAPSFEGSGQFEEIQTIDFKPPLSILLGFRDN